jgi:aspartate/methionine/tyrosine aminotransferase
MELNRIEKTRKKLEEQGKTIVNLSSGNPGEFGINFPPEILVEAFQNFQRSPGYSPDPKGSLKAREAVAGFYRQRGFNLSAENILLTSGTSESYLHLFKMLAKPGESILFPNPGYPLFDHIAGLAGIQLDYYSLDPENRWQIDLPALEEKISPKTKAIVLISPNNPTGGVLEEQTLNGVLALAKKHGLPIISDEVFSEFIFDGKTFPRAGAMGQKDADPAGPPPTQLHPPAAHQAPPSQDVTIFTLNGISKAFALPGLKLSWIAATGKRAPEYLEELELFVDTLLACNQISQAMLPDIIGKGETFLKSYRARVEANRNLAIQALAASKNITFQKPAGGFYLFAQIRNFPGTDEDFVIRMLERTAIFVHPGYFYDYEKGLYVLISFLMEAGDLASVLQKFIQATDEFCG